MVLADRPLQAVENGIEMSRRFLLRSGHTAPGARSARTPDAKSHSSHRAFVLDSRQVLVWHLMAIVALALGHLLVVIVLRDIGPFGSDKVRTFFDLDVEAAPGAYFSALAWLVLAGAALLNAGISQDTRRFWQLAAFLAAFLSLDEAVRIHERFAAIGEQLTSATGIFTISWWVVYPFVLAPILGLALPGFLKLERKLQLRLAVAATIFCVGAVGLELAEAVAVQAFAQDQGLWRGRETDWDAFKAALEAVGSHHQRLMAWYALFEETLEMLGVALALRAVLLHAGENGVEVRLAVRG